MNPQDNINNGQNFFNSGVSYSWNPFTLMFNPICMPVQQPAIEPQDNINTSPWRIQQSGFSSASPPGTASSGSSPNEFSEGYGESPDDLSIDSLIASLLRVVHGEEYVANNIQQPSPIGSCQDCTDVSCDSCYTTFRILQSQQQQQHQQQQQLQQQQQQQLQQQQQQQQQQQLLLPRSPRSPPHPQAQQFAPQIYMAPNEPWIQPMPVEVPPPTLVHDCAQRPPAPARCDRHREIQRFYCQTCSQIFCTECGLHLHIGHTTVLLTEAMERAENLAKQVLQDAQQGVSSLNDDLEALHVAGGVLEQKARQATSDVITCIRRIVQALEEREKDLIEKIESSRSSKRDSLQARDEGIRQDIGKMTKICDRLQGAIESFSRTDNPLDLLITKDRISAEVFQLRSARRYWYPFEENWISFTGPESCILNAISTLGNIITNNPGPIGDRRTVRGRGNDDASPQFYRVESPANLPNQNIPLVPVPRGRAVSGSTFGVMINNGLIGQQAALRPAVQIGCNGDIHDNLCRPWGVACDRDRNIIVADRSNNRIQIFRMDGTLVRRFGTHGTGPGQFDRPAGIAVDSRRRIIVADKDNHRVQVLSMDGQFLLSFGEKGSRLGQFNYPWDVAVNSECQIVVSDTRNHRVQLFSPEGVFLRKYGFETSNSMWKNFDSPRGVAFNPEGNVAVTDFNNHRVLIIDADFMRSRVLGCDVGHGNRQLQRPQGLIVDDEGNIIVADSRNHRVLIFSSTGALKGQIGTADRGPQQMDRPSGVALTPDGRILVVDFGNNRVLLI